MQGIRLKYNEKSFIGSSTRSVLSKCSNRCSYR